MTEKWEWLPHPLDRYGQDFLIEVAHSANPPDSSPAEWDAWGNVTLPARDGWRVTFFYDCYDLDYIDSFETPEGDILEVWVDDYDDFAPVMAWGSTKDTADLLARIRGEETPR